MSSEGTHRSEDKASGSWLQPQAKHLNFLEVEELYLFQAF